MNQCPNCYGQNLVSGKMASTRGRLVGHGVFSPAGQSVWSMSLTGGTRFTAELLACLDCGLVWTFTSAPELREFVQKHCAHQSNGP